MVAPVVAPAGDTEPAGTVVRGVLRSEWARLRRIGELFPWTPLGLVIAAAGTLFVDRERLRSLPATMTELTDALRSGSLVYACPEGTT